MEAAKDKARTAFMQPLDGGSGEGCYDATTVSMALKVGMSHSFLTHDSSLPKP